MRNLEEYQDDEVIEEGKYINREKKGFGEILPGGQIKSEITYINGRATGPFQVFYRNGQLEKEATGRVEFTRVHSNAITKTVLYPKKKNSMKKVKPKES